MRHLIDDTPANTEVVREWIGKWTALASRAVDALAGILGEAPVPLDASAAAARITRDVSRETEALLTVSPGRP